MDYDLLIVGNGFDLGCGHKTSYPSFLSYVGGKGYRNPLISFLISAYENEFYQNEEWNGFENLLCQYLRYIDFLFSDNENVETRFSEIEGGYGFLFKRHLRFKIKDISKLPIDICCLLCSSNPLAGRLEYSIDDSFAKRFSRLDDYPDAKSLYIRYTGRPYFPVNYDTSDVLKMVLSDFEEKLYDLENELKAYIKVATSQNIGGPTPFASNTARRILSFNYSKTAQSIYGVDKDNVAYVHGDIYSDIVLGVEPTMIKNQTFDEESDFIRFFKRFRRIAKDCNKRYWQKIIAPLGENSVIAIYGHSLDLSDRSILRPIFENNYKRYDIYCFRDTAPYKLKLAKLIGMDLLARLEDFDKINFIPINS